MTFQLRDYQIEALEVIDHDLQQEPVALIQAVTGAGKTVTVMRLINRYWYDTDRRFLILAHKQELVEQFVKTARTKTDIPFLGVGVCCAGLRDNSIDKRLTVATVQTFVNQVDQYAVCDLLVIDEAHRVGIGDGSQYDIVIKALRSKNPDMRILGVTATPGRLGHGYIYGDRCKPGAVNLFPRLNHRITYQQLKDAGYLCELRGAVANADSLAADLANVTMSGGDYVLQGLGDVMTKEIHLQTAVQAINEHCSSYSRVCVFCCTIDHADRLAQMIGEEATVVHSQLTPLDRVANIEAWKNGHKRICTSVNILAEGFDFPPLDCLVMARPTMSSTLYLQAIGRALRISPETGKDHAFLLDLTNNTARFGTDIDAIKVDVPKAYVNAVKKDPLKKICPSCEGEVFISLRVCNRCDYEWPAAEYQEAVAVPELGHVTFQAKPPEWVPVTDFIVDLHHNKTKDTWLGRVKMFYNIYKSVSAWFCFEDYYSGYAVERGRETWAKFAGDFPYPNSVEEFEECKGLISRPSEILVDFSGEYPEIKDYKFDKIEVPF